MYITFDKVVYWFNILNTLVTICLDIVWIVWCVRQCFIFTGLYRAYKRRPNLHPIYRDVQYLSQQMKLYNTETHIVKYILVTLCLSVEVVYIVSILVYYIITYRPWSEYEIAQKELLQLEYPTCECGNKVFLLYYNPYYSLILIIALAFHVILFMLLSLITRYLAARYLIHPFRRTLLKYIIWLLIQMITLAICSTIYTIIFVLVILPMLCITNWIILVRDNLILSRVLKSNLQQLENHSNNIQLYKEQQSAYKVYKFMQKILLVTLLLFVVGITMSSFEQLSMIFSKSFCLINVVYGLELHINVNPTIISILNEFSYYQQNTTGALYSVSISLPIICVTLAPIVTACIKRYRSRHYVWRYNYGNTLVRPLITRL